MSSVLPGAASAPHGLTRGHCTDTNLLFTMILERIFFKRYPDVWSILGATVIIGGAVRVAMERKGSVGETAEMIPTGYDPVATAECGLETGPGVVESRGWQKA